MSTGPKNQSKPGVAASGGKELSLIVQITGDASIKEVAERLKKAGHLVERELPISGVIGVKGGEADVEIIGRMPGVKFVKIGGSFYAS